MIIIDRIENGIAVCEVNGQMRDIPLSGIKGKPREGDVLIDKGDGSLLTIDASATQGRRAALSERFERLKARKKKH